MVYKKKNNLLPLKINRNLIIFIAVFSVLVGAIAGGYINGVSFNSMASGNTVAILSMNNNSYNINGKQISSNINTLQFYVNNQPITLGQTIDGVWLAQQKATSGYFIVASASLFSTLTRNDLKPPQNVWVTPSSPKTNEVIYLNANGVWATSTQYGALIYQLKQNGILINYGTTLLRKRSGIYDTAVLGMIGNKDPITGQDTLYHQFYVTLKGGNYNLRMGTYYSNIGTSPYKIYNFNVITPQIIDNSPPIISSFTASPSKVTGIRNILLNANYHSKSGISKAEVIWYNNGEYDFVMVGGSIVISSDTLACGNNNIVLKITGGNGKTAISNINIDKTCIKKKQIIKKKVIKKTVKNITITQNTTTINTTTINTTANIT